MNKNSERLLTLRECENRTGRKIATWRKAIAQRQIPYVKIGRSVRIPQEVIDEMIKKGWCETVKTTVA